MPPGPQRATHRAPVSLSVFGRAPTPGHTKTRLIPALGPSGAADLYAAFLLDTLQKTEGLPEMERTLWLASEADRSEVERRFGVGGSVQPPGDLGAKMQEALAIGLEAGAPSAIVIGTDSPDLPVSYLRAAARRLEDCDVVFGPALDGGFYLLGCRGAAPKLSESVRWSHPRTLDDCARQLARSGRKVAYLSPWYDVDEAADLRLLRTRLRLRPQAAPHTARRLGIEL